MANKTYWTYRAPRTPDLSEAIKLGAIAADTTDAQWHQLSPGMRREVVRAAIRRADAEMERCYQQRLRDERMVELDRPNIRFTTGSFGLPVLRH